MLHDDGFHWATGCALVPEHWDSYDTQRADQESCPGPAHPSLARIRLLVPANTTGRSRRIEHRRPANHRQRARQSPTGGTRR